MGIRKGNCDTRVEQLAGELGVVALDYTAIAVRGRCQVNGPNHNL
jgi:hypothetical protein